MSEPRDRRSGGMDLADKIFLSIMGFSAIMLVVPLSIMIWKEALS